MLCCICLFHFSVSFCYTSCCNECGSCVREKERRAEKTRKEKKRVESNRSKNLPYSEANCIIVLYTSQVLPFLLCDKRVAMYVGGVLKTKKPQNKQKRKPLRWSSRYPRICLSLSPSLTRMPRTKLGWSIEVHFSLSPRSQLIAWFAWFPWVLGGPKSN